MTSSEAGPPPTPTAPIVLAQGHLHPAILFLRFLEGIQRMALLLLLGLLVDKLFLLLALVPFLIQMVYGLAAYLSVQYLLTPDELVTREGILHRQERRIPIDRIQDLAFESTLLRRALGLAVVRVETASGKAAEARLDSLGRADAEQLREVLLQARAARGAITTDPTAPESGAPQAQEMLVHRSSTGYLLVRGLTDLRAGAVFVTAFALIEITDQLGVLSQLRGIAGSFVDWLSHLPPPLQVVLMVALAIGVLAVGALLAVGANLIRFWGFTLTLRDGVLLRRYGLLTTRQKTLPRLRVQRVTLGMTWLRRPFGLTEVRADSASSGFTAAEDEKSGWDLVVPMAARREAERVVPVLLPGLDPRAVEWQPMSPRLVARVSLQGAVMCSFLMVPGLVLWGPWAILLSLLVPAFWAIGHLIHRNFGWGTPPGFLALQRGILGRYQAFIPLDKVQGVVLAAGPVDRMFGLAALTVFVAGGSPTTLTNLTRTDAEGLRALVAATAAEAARGDWRRRGRGMAAGDAAVVPAT